MCSSEKIESKVRLTECVDNFRVDNTMTWCFIVLYLLYSVYLKDMCSSEKIEAKVRLSELTSSELT